MTDHRSAENRVTPVKSRRCHRYFVPHSDKQLWVNRRVLCRRCVRERVLKYIELVYFFLTPEGNSRFATLHPRSNDICVYAIDNDTSSIFDRPSSLVHLLHDREIGSRNILITNHSQQQCVNSRVFFFKSNDTLDSCEDIARWCA